MTVKRRMRMTWGEIAFCAFCTWIIVGALHAWMTGTGKPQIQEGQPCGPKHVWKNIGGPDADLSCERDE